MGGVLYISNPVQPTKKATILVAFLFLLRNILVLNGASIIRFVNSYKIQLFAFFLIQRSSVFIDVLHDQSRQSKSKYGGDVRQCSINNCFLAAPFVIG